MKDTVILRRKRINLFFTLIGIGLLLFTIGLGVYDYMQEQNAVEINATIVSVEAETIGYSAQVTYKVEGKTYDQYHVDLGIKNSLTVGDTTKIKYNIKDPAKLIKNDHLIILSITGVLGILLLLIFLPGRIKIIKKEMNISKLKKTGIKIDANIQDIIVNQKGKRNSGYFPYRLRANYLNPQDNKTYLFESEDTYINPNDVITKYQTKVVTVYLDQTNTKNYYVDILSLIPELDVIDPRDYMKKYYEDLNAKKKAEEEAFLAEHASEEAKEEKKEEKK
ncbi:MAG: DUF3592 domain-containing protein [Bacilli bacterium]|nr:DUF3592 domain-containing protein [Bacilli bacterium]